MANTQTLIATLTGNSMIFSSIPGTYTDLLIKVTMRDLTSGGGFGQTLYMQFNGDGSTLYSSRWLEGNGSSAYSSNNGTNQTGFRVSVVNSTGATNANIFGSLEIYIPNYAGSTFKSYIADYVTENVATGAYQGVDTGIYRSTSAITSLSMGTGFSLSTLCTASLYGINKNA
jgi:hypothetical protein